MHLRGFRTHLIRVDARLISLTIDLGPVHELMKQFSLKLTPILLMIWVVAAPARPQTCQTHDEIPPPAKTALESGAQQVFDQASRGDSNTMRLNAGPLLQAGFDGVAAAVNDNKPALAGARPQIRALFLLDTGPTPAADGRFYCGVFGASGLTGNSAEFDIPGLPAGKFGIAIQDFIGNKGPYSLTTIFQDAGGWKLAGFYVHPEMAGGHDGIWYLDHARDYKAKGQAHNAWFYYITSWQLMAPVTFMDTKLLSKITQESNSAQPKDIATGGNAVTYSANGKTYKITDMSVFPTDKTFDLSIRYSVPSTADFNATQTDARNLANAYITQYPELKDVFTNVMAHAVDASGGDVVGLVALKPASK